MKHQGTLWGDWRVPTLWLCRIQVDLGGFSKIQVEISLWKSPAYNVQLSHPILPHMLGVTWLDIQLHYLISPDFMWFAGPQLDWGVGLVRRGTGSTMVRNICKYQLWWDIFIWINYGETQLNLLALISFVEGNIYIPKIGLFFVIFILTVSLPFENVFCYCIYFTVVSLFIPSSNPFWPKSFRAWVRVRPVLCL